MIRLVAHDLAWIGGEADDPNDHCAHGRVEFTVNETSFVTSEDGVLAVSGAAFFLLRTLASDHTGTSRVAEYNLLFPHCCFKPWPYEGTFKVLCMGCSLGVDIEVSHETTGVRFSSPAGIEVVSENDWKRAVLAFAAQVRAYYRRSTPKADIKDDYDRQGWAAFWQEWDARVDAAECRR